MKATKKKKWNAAIYPLAIFLALALSMFSRQLSLLLRNTDDTAFLDGDHPLQVLTIEEGPMRILNPAKQQTRNATAGALLSYQASKIHNHNINNSNQLSELTSTTSSTNPQLQLPTWITDYFQWHQAQRANLTAYNYDHYRYLILTCGKQDYCGGTADRLRPVLALLRLAANTRRLLLIRWERPAPLEEFLLPHSLDWRVPIWLKEKLRLDRKHPSGNWRGIQQLAESDARVVPTQYQSPTYGATYYNANITAGTSKEEEPTMDEIFSTVWHALFTPSPAVADRIAHQQRLLGLLPGTPYHGIHVRTYYVDDNTSGSSQQSIYNETQTIMQREVEQALRCASQSPTISKPEEGRPQQIFFFASDSQSASKYAVQLGTSRGLQIKIRQESQRNKNSTAATIKTPAVHLGFSEISDPTAFYDIFVDLYLLASSQCVTFGSGGFGQWAHLIRRSSSRGNGDPSCGVRHGKYGKRCSWKKRPMKSTALPS